MKRLIPWALLSCLLSTDAFGWDDSRITSTVMVGLYQQLRDAYEKECPSATMPAVPNDPNTGFIHAAWEVVLARYQSCRTQDEPPLPYYPSNLLDSANSLLEDALGQAGQWTAHEAWQRAYQKAALAAVLLSELKSNRVDDSLGSRAASYLAVARSICTNFRLRHGLAGSDSTFAKSLAGDIASNSPVADRYNCYQHEAYKCFAAETLEPLIP